MKKKNMEIRELIKIEGLHHWMVADRLGVNDTTFSRWLRKELPEEKKQLVYKAINQLKQEKQKAI